MDARQMEADILRYRQEMAKAREREAEAQVKAWTKAQELQGWLEQPEELDEAA